MCKKIIQFYFHIYFLKISRIFPEHFHFFLFYQDFSRPGNLFFHFPGFQGLPRCWGTLNKSLKINQNTLDKHANISLVARKMIIRLLLISKHKKTVKLIQRVKIAHSFLYVISKLFPYHFQLVWVVIIHLTVKEFFGTQR